MSGPGRGSFSRRPPGTCCCAQKSWTKALSSLTEGNRLVGIISHVADLRERIDRQIVVKKEKTGGSRASIVIG